MSQYNSYINPNIKYGSISDTPINMQFTDLINVKTPTNPQDAVPKSYVDALTTPASTYPNVSVVLTGTASIAFWGSLTGVYTFVIQSDDASGPKGKFTVAKTNAGKAGNIQRTINSAGLVSGTQINLSWEPNVGISLYKTNNNYNGTYIITIIDTSENLSSITIPTTTFTLSGITPVSINSDLTGLRVIKILPTFPLGPMASFECCKSDTNVNGNIVAIVLSTTDTNEQLNLTWDANAGINVFKTGPNYNGVYTAYFVF